MSDVAANPRLLVNLKELLDQGLLSGEEFVAEKAKLFVPRADAPVSSSVEHALSTLAAAQVELVKLVGDLAAKTTTRCLSPEAEGSSLKRRSTSEATTVMYRAHDQPGLFDVGVRIVPNPKRPKLQTVRPLSGLLKCPHCAFQCRKPGPMMMHKKNKHKATLEAEASRGAQSVASLMLSNMSSEAREAHSGRLRACSRC